LKKKANTMFIAFWLIRIAVLVLAVRAFVRLSRRYDKSILAYSVSAVLIFAAGFALGLGIMSVVLGQFPGNGFASSLSKWAGLTFGGIPTIVFYYTLRAKWRRNAEGIMEDH
jgi:hypothetical protein